MKDVKVFNANEERVDRKIINIKAEIGLITKGGYRHFMEKEIFEQPSVIPQTISTFMKNNSEIKIDLNKTPIINITWKIEKDLPGIKESTKKGHDFAARVFAVKKTGATPLSTRAINYVCSSNSEIGFNSPSPYTKKSIDNVLATTKDNLNKWITVKANVKEDFKRFHDLDVNELDGLAIMSDTDNSKMKAVAYYQNIYFSAK